VAYETDLPERIRTDPVRVRQILMNLLGNAVKFTEAGSVRLSVAATALDQDRPMIRFSVTDTGPGIPPERLESVFERFNQGEGKTGSAGNGTGLGLTISRRLAELLGGNLRVCSEPGEGSTFTALIDPGPVLGVAKLSAEELSARCCHGRPMPEPDQLPRDLDARVLVADDVSANRTLIQALLRKAGCTVELAENGAEAYERTLRAQRQGRPFDAVLLDMHMPVMDGYEAAARLRSSHYYGPVIALTAHAMAGDREACLSAGCTDYLAKPIDRAQLLGMLASLLPQCHPTGV
jgi:CheY-like chemotaxis protein